MGTNGIEILTEREYICANRWAARDAGGLWTAGSTTGVGVAAPEWKQHTHTGFHDFDFAPLPILGEGL